MACCECIPDNIVKFIDKYPYIKIGLKGIELEKYYEFYKDKKCLYCEEDIKEGNRDLKWLMKKENTLNGQKMV